VNERRSPHSARMTVSSRLLFTVFPRGDDSVASGSRTDCLNIPFHSLTRQSCQFYFLPSNPRLTRNTCPSGWRRCISRTFHGIPEDGNVISSPDSR
jgi:hypothetical protein